jgi:hypothetical protein
MGRTISGTPTSDEAFKVTAFPVVWSVEVTVQLWQTPDESQFEDVMAPLTISPGFRSTTSLCC